jgi:serine/threonine protein kinase
MKFNVKEEFAGRSTRCPTCKQPLTVPAPDRRLSYLPSGTLHGVPSSLACAGVGASVTLEGPATPQTQGAQGRPLAALLQQARGSGQRYLVEGEVGRGGMGAVLRAVDCDIRREVAVKYLLDQNDPHKKLRFVEEAQITGQLEHPNIVPIHELAVDAQKRLFFAMKMVRGQSLAQVLEALQKGTPEVVREYTLARLLALFVNVCHALSYAHARGVIHRDLKPANIMVGDFGEAYVMDWGLAKVLGQAPPVATVMRGSPGSVPTAVPVDASSRMGSGAVVTDRTPELALTQEGSVLGTPVYMPPEQALGRLAEIDQKSDVYALGGILYEILTLQPPIDREGGYPLILKRVIGGEILPPERRALERRGQIPKELSAVALKALATRKEDRYPSVEALRRDIELFQEGRSVSAREDTHREQLIKFVKRNRGFSAGVGLALAVLVGSLVFLFGAWRETRAAYARYREEEQAKREQAREAVPAFVRAARLFVAERNFDDALAQVSVAVSNAEDNAEARLLKAQLLIGRKEFAAAREELEAYLRLEPGDENASRLAELCKDDSRDEMLRLGAMAEVLVRQRVGPIAMKVAASSEQVMALYQERVQKAWPGSQLVKDADGGISLDLSHCKDVSDLGPLRDLPINRLNLYACGQVRDLTPLQGMPLRWLNLGECVAVGDITPLQGMSLTFLSLTRCPVRDLMPLRGMPLKVLDLGAYDGIRDLTPLKGMPITDLNLANCPHAQDLNVVKDLQLTRLTSLCLAYVPVEDLTPLKGMSLESVNLQGGRFRDLTPLKGMPLTDLNLGNCALVADLTPLKRMPLRVLRLDLCVRVSDLTPLQGMELTSLTLSSLTQVRDLTPLQGMPLRDLHATGTSVQDLTPLKGMPLTILALSGSGVSDLTPLQGMKQLANLEITSAAVRDLRPLKGMPLTRLNLGGCGQVQDLTPLRGMPLKLLDLRDTEATDLTPLEGMTLEAIRLSPKKITRGLDVLHQMNSLKTVTPDYLKEYPAAEFWKRHADGEFNK